MQELEHTIKATISYISHIKKDNTILYNENKRLLKEIDHLKGFIEQQGVKSTSNKGSIVNQTNNDISIESLSKSLDECIEELEAYIIQNKN